MILVLGGTGKVGSELVKQIAQAGIKAKVLVRSAQKAESIKKLGLETVEGDVSQIATIEAALKGIESLFLLTTASLNQADTEIAIMDAAKKAGVKKIVLLSAMGAGAQSPSNLGRQHGKSEEHLKALGLAYTILEPHAFMQNILGSASSIKQGAIYSNFKDGQIAMVDARDIAAVALAALTQPGHEGKTYVVTGGETFSYPQLAEKISALTGKKVSYVDVPSAKVIEAMTVWMKMPEWLANDLAKLGEIFAAGHGAATTNVVETVAKKKPITIDEFLKDNVEAFK